MGKFKPARGRKAAPPKARGAIPCLILIVMGLLLMYALFVSVLRPQ
jgi:hypothetical protein